MYLPGIHHESEKGLQSRRLIMRYSALPGNVNTAKPLCAALQIKKSPPLHMVTRVRQTRCGMLLRSDGWRCASLAQANICTAVHSRLTALFTSLEQAGGADAFPAATETAIGEFTCVLSLQSVLFPRICTTRSTPTPLPPAPSDPHSQRSRTGIPRPLVPPPPRHRPRSTHPRMVCQGGVGMACIRSGSRIPAVNLDTGDEEPGLALAAEFLNSASGDGGGRRGHVARFLRPVRYLLQQRKQTTSPLSSFHPLLLLFVAMPGTQSWPGGTN
ncbi:hypothetical protein LX36DRAFT_419565 [Colletotrichum falcatum]|nr:hypothetical protein LX36DRAFT_419565 [Colletotrichum falcatum]